jgi:natural product biosynthesis luciferase-like monooxygenase protein
VAEEWSIVDNLSGGRVGISVASGWHVNDFVLASPAVYDRRRQDMYEKIVTLQKLWRGDRISRRNGAGKEVEVRILPSPIQAELPLSLTAMSDESFQSAGRLGLSVLTSNFANRDLTVLRQRIETYRQESLRAHGRPGHVTMMVHSFAAADDDEVRAVARPAMLDYLETNMRLQEEQDAGLGGGRGVAQLKDEQRRAIVEAQADHNIGGALSFIGPVEACRERAGALYQAGVDELACLIDFGVAAPEVLNGVRRTADLIGS